MRWLKEIAYNRLHGTTRQKVRDRWEEMFGDQVIATAILDRLLHHCRVVNIKDNSFGWPLKHAAIGVISGA
ncbi:ATP-binding protein [Candidatus Magnetominusculus xianensis]|uniref:ATPase AAA n=1 Tax=Candidatus Magnetominusculus xianensis TaxID=1748249 RepID=A0ABR5SB69_9BACT|nr:ATPase AAA [Candidatus Magnetominusculus xianensis]MBF0405517.1 ATP-binding protein [Nitrospirota bacterium]